MLCKDFLEGKNTLVEAVRGTRWPITVILAYPQSLQSKLGNSFIIMLFSNSLKTRTGFPFPELFLDKLFSQPSRPISEPSPTHLGCTAARAKHTAHAYPFDTRGYLGTWLCCEQTPTCDHLNWLKHFPAHLDPRDTMYLQKSYPNAYSNRQVSSCKLHCLRRTYTAIQCYHHLRAIDNKAQTTGSRRACRSSLTCSTASCSVTRH